MKKATDITKGILSAILMVASVWNINAQTPVITGLDKAFRSGK